MLISLIILSVRRGGVLPIWLRWIGDNAVLLSFLIVLFGIVSSLFYSRIIGFAPCSLCIWQRWLLYPQILFSAFALWRGKTWPIFSAGVLSVIGGCLAVFHYYGQMFNTGALPCATNAAVSSCSFTPFVSFGYITIPMMSLTTFAILLVLCWWSSAVGRGVKGK